MGLLHGQQLTWKPGLREHDLVNWDLNLGLGWKEGGSESQRSSTVESQSYIISQKPKPMCSLRVRNPHSYLTLAAGNTWYLIEDGIKLGDSEWAWGSFIFISFIYFSLQWRASQVALVVKNPPANAGVRRDTGSIPGLGRFPWRGAWQPTPVFLPGKSHGQRSLVGYSPQGHKELDVTEAM